MGGIAGIIRFDGALVNPDLVRRMTGAMPYRGVDGISHWHKDSVALGHCMLRTTEEAWEECQPLTNEDQSIVLVMDGWLSNWEELRKELLGYRLRLRNRSDSELVLRAYEYWGKECVAHLDGDYAIVIWDSRRKEAFCFRDRMGNKPFCYHWDGKVFSFSSEPHVLLSLPWVKEVLNEGFILEFLACEWCSQDETFWEEVYRLMAAHSMEVSYHGRKVREYWTPDTEHILDFGSQDAHVEHYKEILKDVVRRSSRTQHHIACEVSGGLDSSAVFAMAKCLEKDSELPAGGVKAYTLDFRHVEKANELDYACAVGEFWNTSVSVVPPFQPSWDWYRKWIDEYRVFPPFPHGVVSMSLHQKAVFDGARVILGGVGGDQWLWGNRDYYTDFLILAKWSRLFDAIRADIRDMGLVGFRLSLRALLPDAILNVWRRLRRHDNNKVDWLLPAAREKLNERKARYLKDEVVPARLASYWSMFRDAYFVYAKETMEQLAAHEGVELRHPLGSVPVVEHAFTVPADYLLKGRGSRLLHREAMRGLLPENVRRRTSKAEFSSVVQRSIGSFLDEGIIGDGMRCDHLGVNSIRLENEIKQFRERGAQGLSAWQMQAWCYSIVLYESDADDRRNENYG